MHVIAVAFFAFLALFVIGLYILLSIFTDTFID